MRLAFTVALAAAALTSLSAVPLAASSASTDTTAAPAVANDDYVTVYQGNYKVIPVLANDTGSNLSIQYVSCPQQDGHANYPMNGSFYEGRWGISWVPVGSVELGVQAAGGADTFDCSYGVIANGDVSTESVGTIHVTVAKYADPKVKLIKRHKKTYVKIVPNNPPAAWSGAAQLFVYNVYEKHDSRVPTSGTTVARIPSIYVKRKAKKINWSWEIRTPSGSLLDQGVLKAHHIA